MEGVVKLLVGMYDWEFSANKNLKPSVMKNTSHHHPASSPGKAVR